MLRGEYSNTMISYAVYRKLEALNCTYFYNVNASPHVINSKLSESFECTVLL